MEKRDLDIIFEGQNWYFYRNKTILVTGATGRLGRYILEALSAADLNWNLNMRIIGLARSEEKARNVFGEIVDLPNVLFLYQDINEKIDYIGTIDFIFHTAGPAAPIDFRYSAVETLWAHVNGTHNVLECAKKHETRRVFYISTVEIYGLWKEERRIQESDMGPMQNLNFRACYPEAKRLCETMLAAYKEEYGIDYCGMRCCHTLGPGILLNDGRGFAEFMQCALEGKDIVLHSDGSAMRTYTYTADAINAAFLIMEKGDSILYNVAAEANLISIRDLALLISRLIPNKDIKVVYGEDMSKMPYLPFELGIMDTTAVREIGWRSRVNLEETFRRTMESFLNDAGSPTGV